MKLYNSKKQNLAENLQSKTVHKNEVYVLELNKGEVINVGYRTYTSKFIASRDMTLIVDRFKYVDGEAQCTKIRDSIDGHEWSSLTGTTSKYLRKICEDRGAKKVKIAGGIHPLVPPNHIAVPNFSALGTEWFIIPEKVYDELTSWVFNNPKFEYKYSF